MAQKFLPQFPERLIFDPADTDPEAQIAAVRDVLRDVGGGDVPELIVINKADIADEMSIARLRRQEPHSVVVSARTGAGIEDLLQAIEDTLPRDEREVHALVPYDRGDLVARVHDLGEVLSQEHTADGTALHARVPARVAAELEPYASAQV